MSRLGGLLSTTEWSFLIFSACAHERRICWVLTSEKHILRNSLWIIDHSNVAVGSKTARIYNILDTITLIFYTSIKLLPSCRANLRFRLFSVTSCPWLADKAAPFTAPKMVIDSRLADCVVWGLAMSCVGMLPFNWGIERDCMVIAGLSLALTCYITLSLDTTSVLPRWLMLCHGLRWVVLAIWRIFVLVKNGFWK